MDTRDQSEYIVEVSHFPATRLPDSLDDGRPSALKAEVHEEAASSAVDGSRPR